MKYAEFNEIKQCIDEADSIAIFSHVSPDGDTLGSGLSLLFFLRKLKGKTVDIYCSDEVTGKYATMKGSNFINEKKKANKVEKYDLSIAVDTASPDRLSECRDLFFDSKRTVIIDHHISNKGFADINLVKQASATVEIIYDFLEYYNKDLIDENIAKLLYTGLITDSGCFQFDSVTNDTFKIAAKLREFNFDTQDVITKFYSNISKEKFELKKHVLNESTMHLNGNLIISHILHKDFKRTNTDNTDTDGLISNLINVDGINIAVLMSDYKNENKFKVSVRTKKPFDSSKICSMFNGGGHVRAGGFVIKGKKDDVYAKIISICYQMYNSEF